MAADDDPEVMPEPDLGLLFSTNATDLSASQIFVDRLPEQQAFDESVRHHLSWSAAAEFDVQDVLAPRHNVLVHFGLGGVGKTALSHELERRHASDVKQPGSDWPGWDRPFTRSVTARIDLASEVGFDLERVLLSIRLAVASLGRPMHAFDIALTRYWDVVHPNESVAEFLRRDGRLRRVAQALQLPDQIDDGLKDVMQALGGVSSVVSLGSRLAKLLATGVHRSVVRRHAVQECRRLGQMLTAKADLENLSYYPHLLAWDLSEAWRRSPDFHVTVFLDTFEDVAQGEQRRLEQMINRLVWLMPNVLFVISGRNRLEWGDARAEGRFWRAGPVAWPGLTSGAAIVLRQHLVGHLSTRDAERFLRDRLRRDGASVIPEDIRDQIARDSSGYPLYLDLAVLRFLQLAGSGARPAASDFIGGFPDLVERVLRDLTDDERRLARVTALLDSFDVALIASIADLRSEAIGHRLIRRAFVEYDERAPFPYTVHRLLRAEIRRADVGDDAFTEADWARYAGRAFDALGARFAVARAANDRPTLIGVLNQALRLADEYDLPVGWTDDAAYAFIDDPLWESALRPRVRTPAATAAAALAETLSAITDRQVEGRRRTADVLTSLLATGLLDGDGADLATYYAAEALRESGRGDEAVALLESLISSDSRIADLAVKGMVHQLRRGGRFVAARELIGTRPESAMWLQMSGTLLWSQGMLDQSRAAYLRSRDLSLAEGRPGQAAEIGGCLAFVCGLSGRDASLVEQGRAVLQGSRQTWGRLMAELGHVLLSADGGDLTTRRLSELAAEGDEAGLTSIQAYAGFGICLNAAVTGDEQQLETTRAALAEQQAGGFRWLLEVVDFWFGGDRPADDSSSDWIGGRDDARGRWRKIVEARRRSVEASGC